MKLLTHKQGTHEWFSARAGKVTGSRVCDVMAFLKNGQESQKRADYRTQLVAETLTGIPDVGGYLSPEMQWGNETEALARAAYEMEHDVMVDTVGFALHDNIERFGGSPDGLIGDVGIIEIKCPKSTTHLRWMMADVVPPEHVAQMLAYLSITGREYADFVSFDPRLPRRHQMFVKRLPRDEVRIQEVEVSVRNFLSEVDCTIDILNRRNPGKEPPPKAKLHVDPSLMITDDDAPEWMRPMLTR